MTYNNVLLTAPTLIEARPTNIRVERIGSAMFVVLAEVSEQGYSQEVVFNVSHETITALEKAVEILRDNITSQSNPNPSVN